jgi:PTH1 family peptidyl-tRNA hydrolase
VYLLVGLGNPGREYESTRHNAGFEAIDLLARAASATAFREKFSGEYATGSLSGEPVVLLRPLTYMNLSGQCVQPAAAFFKVPPARIIVLHDELDVPLGQLRAKVGGGHAGHNGLRDIQAKLGTPEFARVRIGIGRPGPGFKGTVADFVLQRFDAYERGQLEHALGKAQPIVEAFLAGNAGKAATLANATAKAGA